MDKNKPTIIFNDIDHTSNDLPLPEFMEKWMEAAEIFKSNSVCNHPSELDKVVEADNGAMFRFMAYWISFSHMLEVLYKNHVNYEERDRIRAFCFQKEYYNLLKTSDVFSSPDYEMFASRIISLQTVSHNGSFKIINKKDKSYFKLLSDIYTVRNNLVHGNKTLQDPTDKCLIWYGANILEKLLHVILGHNQHQDNSIRAESQ